MLMLGCSCCSIHAFPSNNQIILFSNTAVVAGSCKRRRRPHRCSIVVVLNSRNYNNIPDGTSSGGRDDDEDISSSSSSSNNNSEIDDSNNNDLLYYELNKIKQDMFGTNIPSNDELTTAAQNSEADFLAAMLEQTQQFQQIKLNEGSERACEVFMERIQAEDEADRDSTGVGKFSDRIESAEQGDAIESDDSGFEEDTMWYEQEIFQVDETTIKISKEIDVTDGNNFWQ
ncbi:hypothetical protein ACHAWU_007421 [Discostella pseudostelligera]|uniref:Uncharacterized protein n=1 Tax=Discostella pseudostelligera TaxID=259834 RepID=A0ABD3MAX3_9STRA